MATHDPTLLFAYAGEVRPGIPANDLISDNGLLLVAFMIGGFLLGMLVTMVMSEDPNRPTLKAGIIGFVVGAAPFLIFLALAPTPAAMNAQNEKVARAAYPAMEINDDVLFCLGLLAGGGENRPCEVKKRINAENLTVVKLTRVGDRVILTEKVEAVVASTVER